MRLEVAYTCIPDCNTVLLFSEGLLHQQVQEGNTDSGLPSG